MIAFFARREVFLALSLGGSVVAFLGESEGLVLVVYALAFRELDRAL